MYDPPTVLHEERQGRRTVQDLHDRRRGPRVHQSARRRHQTHPEVFASMPPHLTPHSHAHCQHILRPRAPHRDGPRSTCVGSRRIRRDACKAFSLQKVLQGRRSRQHDRQERRPALPPRQSAQSCDSHGADHCKTIRRRGEETHAVRHQPPATLARVR